MTKELLCIHGSYRQSGVLEEIRREESQPPAKGPEFFVTGEKQVSRAAEFPKARDPKFREDVALVFSLKACAKSKDLCEGSRIHADILKHRLHVKDIYVGTALVDMYAKCGALLQAQEAFDKLPVRNVVSWNALIAGYTQHGKAKEALYCFEQMQREGLSPDAITLTCSLKACGSVRAAVKGREIHAEVVRQGLLGKDVMLSTALVDMYAKCGALAKAQEVFDEHEKRDVVSWNALIAGYAQNGNGTKALKCFDQMQNEGLSPNVVTFISILQACGSIGAAEKGEQVHAEVVRQRLLEKSVMLGNALVDMYVKCGALAKAQQVFNELSKRSVVSWSILIAGYVQHGYIGEALYCFKQMEYEGISPDTVTFIYILKACSSIGAVEKGEQVHAEVVRQGLLEKDVMLGTALVDMYAKCGALAKAEEVFYELSVRNVISWNALIAGYAKHEHNDEALDCFEQMQQEGFHPDAITCTCILKACGSVGAAEKGKELHTEVVKQGLLGKDVVLGTALVDMYVKCGAFVKAQEVFDDLPVRNAVSWSVLIAGYAQHGHGNEALKCFEHMQQEALSPNDITFTVLLNACSHSGLVDEGQMYFAIMRTDYGINPTLEHHTCMVDLFGRAGYFDKAIQVIEKLPPLDCHPLWFALLGACRKWGNVKLGRLAFEHIVRLDEKDGAAYVCMSDMYAAAGMQEEANMVEVMRVKREAWKVSNHCWWTNVNEYIIVDSSPLSTLSMI